MKCVTYERTYNLTYAEPQSNTVLSYWRDKQLPLLYKNVIAVL